MSAVIIATAILAVAFAAASVAVVTRARRLARLTARVEADALEPRSTFPTVVIVPARHVRTTFVASGAHADWLTAPPGSAGELGITDRELVLAGPEHDVLRIPVRRIVDAAFVRTVEQHTAGDQLALLRVVWTRGGEQLSTTLGLEVPWVSAEKLRREIHLRMTVGRSV